MSRLICFDSKSALGFILFILAIIQHTVQLCMGCVGLSTLYYCAVYWLPVIWIRCDWTISYKSKYVACLYGRKASEYDQEIPQYHTTDQHTPL